MKVYALVPARSGSKGLPDKNALPILWHPLIGHAVAFAKKVSSIDRVFVSTDSERYRGIALKYGAECPTLRSPAASSDSAMEEDVLADVVGSFEKCNIPLPDIWVWLKPTSPLRSVSSVEYAITTLRQSNGLSAVRVVSEADARLQKIDDDGMLRPLLPSWPRGRSKIRRTEVPQTYRPFNLEVFRHKNFEKFGAGFMGDAVYPVIEAKFTGLDIDDHHDYELLKALIESRPAILKPYVHL